MYKYVHLPTSLIKTQKNDMTLIFFTTAVHLLCNSKRECELIFFHLIPCRPKHILYKGTPPFLLTIVLINEMNKQDSGLWDILIISITEFFLREQGFRMSMCRNILKILQWLKSC